MLADKEAMATIAVKDLDGSRKFYEDVLGLKRSGAQAPVWATYSSGNSTILVYQSEFAGTNKATSATWGVGDQFESIVATLKRAGVSFERYDVPGARHEGDVHVFGEFRAAWFKDPDGNILHVNNG